LAGLVLSRGTIYVGLNIIFDPEDCAIEEAEKN